jgi:CFEM domain
MTRGATSFTKAILLVLLTSARPSLQDANYSPGSFSNWNELRSCAQSCLDYGAIDGLGCSLNDCYCRADIVPQAVSIVSVCASSSCSNTNDVVSATSFYEAYCASVTNTAVISLITNNPPAVVSGSTVTGTISMLLLTKIFFPSLSSLFLMILNEDYICL